VVRGSVVYDGTLEIEIGGTTPRSFDRIEHRLGDDIAMLGGALDVRLINGFEPKVGDSFGFLFAAGGYGGTFDVLHLPDLAPGKVWALNPGNSTVFLQGHAGLSADFNHDGRVDADDLAKWRNDAGQNAGSDANQDGASDGADLLAWQRQVGMTMAVAAGGVVPEPTALVLLLAAVLPAARRFRVGVGR
jgi:hypothetical protein